MNLHVGIGGFVVTLNHVATLEYFTDLNISDNNACTSEKCIESEEACSLSKFKIMNSDTDNITFKTLLVLKLSKHFVVKETFGEL